MLDIFIKVAILMFYKIAKREGHIYKRIIDEKEYLKCLIIYKRKAVDNQRIITILAQKIT